MKQTIPKKTSCPAIPTLGQAKIHFLKMGLSAQVAEAFFYYHKRKKWTTLTGKPIRNWKVQANNWVRMHNPGEPKMVNIKFSIRVPQGQPVQITPDPMTSKRTHAKANI